MHTAYLKLYYISLSVSARLANKYVYKSIFITPKTRNVWQNLAYSPPDRLIAKQNRVLVDAVPGNVAP